MEAFVNELSARKLSPTIDEGKNRLGQLLKTMQAAQKKGIVRFVADSSFYETQLTHYYSINSWLGDNNVGRLQRQLLPGLVRRPFLWDEENALTDSLIEGECQWGANGEEATQAYGLAAALYNDSLAISFSGEPHWEEPIIQITCKNQAEEQKPEEVRNACFPEHIEFHSAWFASWQEITLVKSLLEAQDKEITLSGDHHGNDLLEKRAKRLRNSEYVIGIIHSLPYNSNTSRFIHRVHDNGQIEVHLWWTDEGYGMMVQTTGRNKLETQEIAKILNRKYGGK